MKKSEVLAKFNKLISKGKIFDDKLPDVMEAYKVRRVGKDAKYNYTCCVCVVRSKVMISSWFADCGGPVTGGRS